MTNIFNEKETLQDRKNFIQPKFNENFKLLMWRLHNTGNSWNNSHTDLAGYSQIQNLIYATKILIVK